MDSPFFVFIGMLADIREALWYLVAANGCLSVAVLLGAFFLGRKRS